MAKNITDQSSEAKAPESKKEDKEHPILSRVSKWLSPRPKKRADKNKPADGGPAESRPPAEQKQARRESLEPLTATAAPPEAATPPPPEPEYPDDDQSGRQPGAGRKRPRKRPPRHRKAQPDAQPPENPPVAPVEEEGKEKSPLYRLLINTDEPEECRIALMLGNMVEDFFIETVSHAQTKGNIYKGTITSVEPNLQAAFVDIGLEKNGFLAFSEIHPEYYCREVAAETHWKDLQIQDYIRRGQEVLVEVVKEATESKGANLTTYLSLPGRYVVLMPGSDSAGISRKIEDEEQRSKLREMVDGLNIPEGIGYIIRTASLDITKTAISQDIRYLLNLWKDIKDRGQTRPAPALIYKEQNIIARFLRDHYHTDIQEILVDDQEAYDQVQRFFTLLPAAQSKKTAVRLHKGAHPLFHQYHVEKQIEQIYQPRVPLPSGGSIVINPTEALVAIDVNSGRTGKDKNFEETIFLANMEAAEELARQLRLRDLGGLIVVDFIDMRDQKHVREVEKKVRDSMKRDKAKVDFSKISKFGLLQISRQKMAAPVQAGSYRVCRHCEGRGMVRSVETLALVYLRQLQNGVTRKQIKRVSCRLPMEVAQYILNRKREDLLELEKLNQVEISIEPDPSMGPAEHRIEYSKEG